MTIWLVMLCIFRRAILTTPILNRAAKSILIHPKQDWWITSDAHINELIQIEQTQYYER